MDHSHHNHGDIPMPMPGHGGGMEDMCSMNMLFTWDTKNLCIVFRGWRVTGAWSLLFSLLAIVALTAGYEAVREASRRYESNLALKVEGRPRVPDPPTSYSGDHHDERSSLLGSSTVGSAGLSPAEERSSKIVRALFYAAQVFYSFFIMLLFMTYNGWIMIAVAMGAFVGFLMFAKSSATKSAACH